MCARAAEAEKSFLAAIRNRIFTFLRALASADPDQALSVLEAPEDSEGIPWTAERLGEAMESYHSDHERIRLDPRGRNARHTRVTRLPEDGIWKIEQVLVDPDEHCDWVAEFDVLLEASRARGEPALRLRRIGPMV